jgi:hypothetical protein
MDDARTRKWAKQAKASWEMAPLVEMNRGERVQVGFELELYARIPPEAAAAADEPTIDALWNSLREIAESLPACLGDDARIELEPFEPAGRLRPETGFAPEVLLKARLIHATDYFAPVDDAERRGAKQLEDRLSALGLRQRSW